ncbi:hypothetical protein HDV05_000246 [Chytridiales sp. JEL 0842]|nr:hypothetical protein HDV05_000246 [Chytridiales sp. JEL 0842]
MLIDFASPVTLSSLEKIMYKHEDSKEPCNIGVLMPLNGLVSLEEVKEEVKKFVSAYPRARQVLVMDPMLKEPVWTSPFEEDDPEETMFDLTGHIQTLHAKTEQHLQMIVSKLTGELITFEKPPWRLYVIQIESSKYARGKQASILFWKFHHCMGDGQGLMRSFMSIFGGYNDPTIALKTSSDQIKIPHEYAPAARHVQTHSADDTPSSLFGTIISKTSAMAGFTYSAVVSYSNMFRMVMNVQRDFDVYPTSNARQVAWTTNISLEKVKLIKRVYKVTVNDVLFTIAVRAIRAHILERKGGKKVNEKYIIANLPISLRPIGDTAVNADIPCEPLCIPMRRPQTFVEDLQYIHEQTSGGKKCGFAGAMFLRYALVLVMKRLFHIYRKSKAAYGYHTVISNVPGFSHHVRFAGQRIESIVGIGPCLTCPISVAIISYASHMSVSFNSRLTTSISPPADPYGLCKDGAVESMIEYFEKDLEEVYKVASRRKVIGLLVESRANARNPAALVLVDVPALLVARPANARNPAALVQVDAPAPLVERHANADPRKAATVEALVLARPVANPVLAAPRKRRRRAALAVDLAPAPQAERLVAAM